jgi:hypothetical protein
MLFVAGDLPAECGAFGYWADAISKIVAAAGVVGGGLWALIVYFEGRRSDGRTAALAAKQPFLAKRLELYLEATSCVATIVVSLDDGEVARAKLKFWNLYWGPMSMIEDSRVEAAMKEFKTAMSNSHSPDLLQAASANLALSCPESMKENWEVKDRTDS